MALRIPISSTASKAPIYLYAALHACELCVLLPLPDSIRCSWTLERIPLPILPTGPFPDMKTCLGDYATVVNQRRPCKSYAHVAWPRFLYTPE
jgi:hypothetical protein